MSKYLIGIWMVRFSCETWNTRAYLISVQLAGSGHRNYHFECQNIKLNFQKERAWPTGVEAKSLIKSREPYASATVLSSQNEGPNCETYKHYAMPSSINGTRRNYNFSNKIYISRKLLFTWL